MRRGLASGGKTRTVSKRERNRFQQPTKSVQRYDLAMAAIAMMEGRPVDADTQQVLQDIALAQRLYNAGQWDDAEPIIRKFLKRKGFIQPMTYDALGSIAQYQGRYGVAIECFRKALALDPDYVEARNRIIMILDVQPDTTIAMAQREREKWWTSHGASLYARRRPHLNSRDPERPIRIGYVSGDFQYHSAATVFHRIALNHSEGFEPYFYSSTPSDQWDSITNSYMAMPGWRNCVERKGAGSDLAWPDVMVLDKIRDDRIDILVDLSGYTAWNRLQMFCYKPAPIQVTGWGYATGVGWPAMDYLISDRVVIPEDRQREHVEKILYLPSVIDYEPTAGLPDANPLPCLTERPTFGVFQRSLKINAEDVEVWRQVLERLPESRLIMKGQYCPSLTAWIRDRFGSQITQVEFQPVTSSFDHKVAYQQVDLNLDPWPQTAGVSACDALWMGVPAVTLIGPRVIQRTTASLLTTLGLTDFIAETPEQYVDTAAEWVTTRKHELAEIRQGLRAKCDASPIRTGYRDATETAFRQIWREWCAKPLSIADARFRLEQAS